MSAAMVQGALLTGLIAALTVDGVLLVLLRRPRGCVGSAVQRRRHALEEEQVERLTRIVNGYDRTPHEQRAADAEAKVAQVQASADAWWSEYDRELTAHGTTTAERDEARAALAALRELLSNASAALNVTLAHMDGRIAAPAPETGVS